MKKRAKQPGLKMFVVRSYVRAKNVPDALRKAKKQPPDDCFVDPDWKEGKNNQLAEAIGFDDGIYEEEEDEA